MIMECFAKLIAAEIRIRILEQRIQTLCAGHERMYAVKEEYRNLAAAMVDSVGGIIVVSDIAVSAHLSEFLSVERQPHDRTTIYRVSRVTPQSAHISPA